MEGLILIIRIGLMLTGIAVWVLISAIVFGIVGYRIRTWDGWQRIRDWWREANGYK